MSTKSQATTFAEAAIPSGLPFPRNAQGSRTPDEALDLADLDQAMRVLVRFLGGD